MIRKNGFWIDENNNKWDISIYTKECAEKLSLTLINCQDCQDCQDCRDCRDYDENPQRIYSKRIGSRKSQTIIYFDEKLNNIQIICGCFGANSLKQFETRINDNYPIKHIHNREYMDFITKARRFIYD